MITRRRTLTSGRVAPRARPACESLEGRALLAHYSAYDPTFGQRGVVVGAVDNGTGTELSRGYAVAVQPDGKIVEVGTYSTASSTEPYGKLAVRRFNADGSVDTAFGTNGQADIPLPGGAIGIQVGPQDVVVGGDGSIYLAATAALPGTSTGFPKVTEGFVAKVTGTGVLDTGFGTGGEYVFAGTTTSAASVALDSAGNLVVLGGVNDTTAVLMPNSQSPTANRLVVTRLTAAGVPDPTFNGTGSLDIDLPASQLGGPSPYSYRTYYDYTPAALVIAPGGQIMVAGNDVVFNSGGMYTAFGNLVRVNTDGTLDTTYGTGGTATVAATIEDTALDALGNLVVVGNFEDGFTYHGVAYRLLPGGTLDPTFAANFAATKVTPQNQGLTYNSVVIGDYGAIIIGGSDYYGGGPGAVVRITPFGVYDATFGIQGIVHVTPSIPASGGSPAAPVGVAIRGIALTAGGNFVVAGGLTSANSTNFSTSYYNLLAQLQPVKVTGLSGDYDGDGISDIAAYLTGPSVYAYRPSAGASDVLQTFGPAGASVPAPGDYDGDGKADLAVYVPSTGKLYYRSSANRTDLSVTIGGPGDIAAPGDYDGDGTTDAAVYDPSTGSFIIIDSSTHQTQTIPFGAAGANASIPAPGDYDGDGKTDLAVYLPQYGVLAYRPSSGGPDVLQSFGAAGARMSIPAPGDYDGDGKTDPAVYLPAYGVYAYRPSSGGDDVLTSFGVTGDGASIPAPGDYDGDGKYDVAVYIPQYALYAYRLSSAVAGSSDALTNFGTVGDGATVPASSIPYAQPPTVSGMSVASSGGVSGVPIALTDDVLELLAGGKKKRS